MHWHLVRDVLASRDVGRFLRLLMFVTALCLLMTRVWHLFTCKAYNLGQILTLYRPPPPPIQIKGKKWLILAFARLHPWFRGGRAGGWGFAVTFSSVQDCNLGSWTKLMENLAPPPSQNHGWKNGISWLRRGFILDFGGIGVCCSFYCV